MGRAEVVQPDRLAETAEAPWLDVDDPARAGCDGRLAEPYGLDGLIQTDRRLQTLLQHGVIGNIVVVERLLDHHQSESIQPREVIGVGQRVRGVGIHHQRNRSEPVPHGPHRVDVPTRLDLDLDSPVSGGALAVHFRRQLVERILNADRDARGNAIARPAERAAERLATLPRVQIPRRHLDRRFRHVVAADGFQRRKYLSRVIEVDAEHARRDELRDDVPRRLVRFGAVVRILLGDAFTERGHAAPVQPYEDEVLVVRAAEAGFEKVHERELEQTQLEPIDLHGAMISSARLALPLHCD